jgi:hypothetical protein
LNQLAVHGDQPNPLGLGGFSAWICPTAGKQVYERGIFGVGRSVRRFAEATPRSIQRCDRWTGIPIALVLESRGRLVEDTKCLCCPIGLNRTFSI